MDEMALDPTAGNDGSEAASALSCLGATGGSSSSRLDSQLQEAIRLKTEGNGFYREKNVRTAIGRYHRALLVLRGLDSEVNNALQGFGAQVPKLNQEQEDVLRSTQVDCYNNLADADVKKQLQRVEERLSQDYKKEKALYKGMFSKQKQGEEQFAEEKTQNLV